MAPNADLAHIERDGTATPPEGHRWFAALYERINRFEERRVLAKLRHDLLGGVAGDVLEIGAGTGANFPHYGASARVVATDPDVFMLACAEKKLHELALTNVSLRQAGAESLPFADASFDAVVSTLVLCTVPDVAGSLTELARVLRPGGRLLFIEHVRSAGWPGRLQDAMRPAWSWFSAGCEPNRRTEQALRDAGWDVTVRQRRDLYHMPLLEGYATRP